MAQNQGALPTPVRSWEECDEMLTQKGSFFEMEEVVVRGKRMLAWKNAPLTFRHFLVERLGRWAAEGRTMLSAPTPEPAPFYERAQISYTEVYAAGVQQAAWLREMGIRAGDRVGLCGGNSAGWIAAFIAICLVGAVPVLTNAHLQLEAQFHCLGLTQPKVVLADGKYAAMVAPHHEKLAADGVGKMYSWDDLNNLPAEARAGVQEVLGHKPHPATVREVEQGTGTESVGPESDAMIYFTSGTTSMPKGVILTHRAAMAHVPSGSFPSARAILRFGGSLEDALTAHNPPEVQPVMLLAVPLFHVTGSLGWMVRAFVLGCKMVFMRRWNTKDAVDIVVAEKVGFIGGVPAIATAILQSPHLPKGHIIDGVTYGGGPPPERLASDIYSRWPNAVATHAYGMTETAGLIHGIVGPDYVANPEAVGRPVPFMRQRIVDLESLQELPVGAVGLLQVRGAAIMREYVNNPKATAEAIDPEGWFSTGDVAKIDEHGLLYIRDRAKDVIIRGGENVENAVYRDSRIAEAAAVPVPCERYGERVGVCVSLAPGATATPESILALVEPRLRHAAHPAIVVVLRRLPRNPNGKIVKSDVAKAVREAWDKVGGGKRAARL